MYHDTSKSLTIAVCGLRGIDSIDEWLGVIGHEGIAQVVYQNKATSVYRSRSQKQSLYII